MRVSKLVFLPLFVMMSTSIYAQSNSKVIANKADWCGVFSVVFRSVDIGGAVDLASFLVIFPFFTDFYLTTAS